MKRKNVLDSSALLVFLQKEPGCGIIKEKFEKALQEREVFLLNMVNLGEICYIVKKRFGEAKTREVLVLIEELPISLYPASKEIIIAAADLKADYSLPYIDAICAATAQAENATLFTSDSDFKKVEPLVPICWVK